MIRFSRHSILLIIISSYWRPACLVMFSVSCYGTGSDLHWIFVFCCILDRVIFTRTMRGKEQVIFHGQPFIQDKEVQLKGGITKRIWRCNQWWSGKCRARISTINDAVTILKDEHTHSEVVMRKKRAVRPKGVSLVD